MMSPKLRTLCLEYLRIKEPPHDQPALTSDFWYEREWRLAEIMEAGQ